MLSYKISTQSQYWIQASPFQHYFTTFSGIRDTAGTSQYADGVRGRIFIDFHKTYGCEFISVTVTPVTCGEDPQPLGQRTITIPDAQLTSINFGQADRTSANPSTIELTFVLDTFTYN